MVEMLASLVIFSIVALMAVPMAETYRDRQTEVVLRDRLTRIRAAIRSYSASETTTLVSPCGSTVPGDLDGDGVAGEDGAGDLDGDGLCDDDLDGNVDEDGMPVYPPTLEALVEKGYLGTKSLTDDGGAAIPSSAQFPRDPTNLYEPDNLLTWVPRYVSRTFRFRCRGDAANAPLRVITYTGIYDVRSSSKGVSLAGVPYSDF